MSNKLVSEEDIELVRSMEGVFAGSLSDSERQSFERCISDGIAYRSYEGTSAVLGLAKVRNT